MTTIAEAHGWQPVRLAGPERPGVRMEIAPLVDPERQCGCTGHGQCHRQATQEDLLCDNCRGGHA